MNYTFHSTDPDNYNEVRCPIIYTGVSKFVKWWASELTTLHNIIVLDTSDYIIFENEIGEQRTWHPSQRFTDINANFDISFNNDNKDDDVQIKRTELNTIKLTSFEYFRIIDMSYNCKQVFGFYYMDKVDVESQLVLEGDDKDKWVIESKSIGFKNLTPVWFLISNLGQPNQINTHNNKWTPLFPAVVMNIQNSFANESNICYSNSDYQAESPSSALSNLRVKLVDGNLEPIHLLNPLYVTIYVQEIPEDQKAETEEAMAMMEINKETLKVMEQTINKYHAQKEENSKKVQEGITIEPPLAVFPEKQEVTIEQIAENKVVLEQEAEINTTHEQA